MSRFDCILPKMTVFTVILTCLLLMSSSGHGFTIIDDEQQTIEFTQPFTRIISLYPAHTENLAYLGATDQLVGISTSDTYPAHVLDKKRYSYRDNTEKFLAASADLILIRPMISRAQPELIEKLRSSGITIVSLQPTSIDSMFSYWHKLGLLTGKSAAADEMIASFQKQSSSLTASLPKDHSQRPGVYFESIHAKMKTFAPDSISIYTLSIGGGRNVALGAKGRNESNIAPYGKERILSQADSIDVFLSQVGRMNRVSLEDIYGEPGFQLIKAVRNKAVYLIDEEIVSRPTMRILKGAERIQSILYPGATPQAVLLPGSTQSQPDSAQL